MQWFEKKVFKSIKPKMVNNTVVTSQMFLKLTLEYVEAINSGGIPQILTSLERVIQQEARKITEDMKNLYLHKINDLLSKTKGPYEDEELQGAFKLTS